LCEPMTMPTHRRAVPPLLVALAGLALAGCEHPIQQRTQSELREAATATLRRQIAEADRHAQQRTLELDEDLGRLEIRDEHLEEIAESYSVPGYLERLRAQNAEGADPIETLVGENLYGTAPTPVPIALFRAMSAAVEHGLDVEFARYEPAIREAELVAAEAAFDWTLNSSVTWDDRDTPQPGPGFLMLGPTRNASQTVTGSAGVSRALTTGGTLGLTQSLSYFDERGSAFGGVGDPNPSSTVQLDVEVNQPLLRGFGSETNLAEVRIARNAERAAIAALRDQLISTVTDVEDAYWDLVESYNILVIRTRLLERGEEVRDDIKARRVLDARQAEVADAVASVEARRGNVLRARTNLRRASDRLKRLINDPDLPVGGELLLIPADAPLADAFSYSLSDALAEAIGSRPDIERAILNIDDASIREVVAKNASLPRLDLQARLTLFGFGADASSAYDDTTETEFIDNFLLGVEFSQPIGNRGPEANLRRTRLLRMRSVVDFRRTVQNAVLDVKNALNNVVINHELISQARLSRIAQAEALRTLLVDKEFGQQGFSVTRLDLELGQQDALAAAEIEEIRALIDYNRSIADLHRATGTALSRNRIDFVVPDVNQIEPGNRALDYRLDAPPDAEAGD